MCEYDSGESRDPLNKRKRAALLAWKEFMGPGFRRDDEKGWSGDMPSNDLYRRDAAAIGSLQKLRFFPSALIGGKGVRVTDQSGRSLLDLSAAWGAASLGYGHPAGASVLSSANLPSVELAEALLATLPDNANAKVWLGHSGSDPTRPCSGW
jgi:4-aminobutyrate aminotransferase-like enzyme